MHDTIDLGWVIGLCGSRDILDSRDGGTSDSDYVVVK